MIPLATGETWLAVFGGLIPVIGLGLGGYLVYRAARGSGDGDEDA